MGYMGFSLGEFFVGFLPWLDEAASKIAVKSVRRSRIVHETRLA
jgi:hypothetical protein